MNQTFPDTFCPKATNTIFWPVYLNNSSNITRYLLAFLSIFLLATLLTFPIKGSTKDLINSTKATLTLSTDNAEEVYFNGVRLGGSDVWQQASTYQVPLQTGENVLAVKATDASGIAAFIAELATDSKSVVSDSSWKISKKWYKGWNKADFNDNNWAPATSYGQYGVKPWRKNVKGFPNTSSAQWIWSKDRKNDNTVYVRYTLEVAAPLNIALNQLPNGKAGIVYNQTVFAKGGVKPYSWQIVKGKLPEGVALNPVSGEIYGSPSRAETATFSVQVTDNVGKKAIQELTLAISTSSMATLTLSTDNAEEVYFNGVRLGGSDVWQQASTYQVPLQTGENVLAVKATDASGIAAFIAELATDSKSVVSDSSWKISKKWYKGWNKADFNDNNWAPATSYGQYGVKPWRKNVKGFPNTSSAQWIWSKDRKNDNTVYVRYTLNLQSPTGKINEPITVKTNTNTALDINLSEHATDPVGITVIGEPSHGKSSVNADKIIKYVPDSGYTGQDTFLIKIVNADGTINFASVTITVGNTILPKNIRLTLNWSPNSDTVAGYLVYYGPTSGTVTQQLSDLHIESGEINPKAPSVTYDVSKDLQMQVGDNVCFGVKAYNTVGESTLSKLTCAKI